MTCFTEYPKLNSLANTRCWLSNLKPLPEISAIKPLNLRFSDPTLKLTYCLTDAPLEALPSQLVLAGDRFEPRKMIFRCI